MTEYKGRGGWRGGGRPKKFTTRYTFSTTDEQSQHVDKRTAEIQMTTDKKVDPGWYFRQLIQEDMERGTHN